MRRGLVWSLIFFITLSLGALAFTVLSGRHILLGLDLKGGVSVVLQPQGTVDNATLQEAVNIIDRRVNGLGVSNAEVERQGRDVVISLPGIKDPQAAIKTLGSTAVLYFRPVECEIPPYAAPTSTPSTTVPRSPPHQARPATPTTVPVPTSAKAAGQPGASYRLTAAELPASVSASAVPAANGTSPTTVAPSSPTTTTPASPTSAEAQAACSSSSSASIPSTNVADDAANAYVILPYYDNSVRYVLGPADMKGNVISNTSVIVPTTGGGYEVQITFTSSGATQFDNIAAERYPYYKANPSNPGYQAQEAIELDAVVISAPVIQAESFNGVAVISGGTSAPFSSSQASNLSIQLKYGSLPVRFVPQSLQTVSASIGRDSLRAGLLAGIGGIIVVMMYMLLYYRGLALVVLAGLGLGGALLYSVLANLSYSKGLTLTLAGVTGIIVSIGITVDSYVVYFERLKDEVRSGRTIRQSVDRSFARAFRTVLTADLVSFMAALILYLFTIGDVRGFAFTLGLSTLIDVFTAYFFIRPAVILLGRRRSFTENRLFGMSRGLGVRPVTREA
jgi:preprotein translocase subunit SecD